MKLGEGRRKKDEDKGGDRQEVFQQSARSIGRACQGMWVLGSLSKKNQFGFSRVWRRCMGRIRWSKKRKMAFQQPEL